MWSNGNNGPFPLDLARQFVHCAGVLFGLVCQPCPCSLGFIVPVTPDFLRLLNSNLYGTKS